MDSSRAKILFLIPSLVGGGAERVMVHIVRHLDRTKFAPILAVVNTQSAAFLQDVPSDIEFIDLKCSRVRFSVFKIINLIWKKKPSLVFSTLGHLNLMLAILKPFLPKNIRYLCRETIVLSESLKTRNNLKFWEWGYKTYYKRFDKIICQSVDMQDDLHYNFGIQLDKLAKINNPADVERIRSLANEPIDSKIPDIAYSGLQKKTVINLISVGRMVRQKGFDLLIKALALNANPDMHLTLLGEGELEEELWSLAKSEGVDTQIHFAGFQKNPYAFMARADAFVLSSRYEGFPNVVLESLVCGTPVIATPAPGGIQEILGGIEGCMIAESISAEALAQALSTFTFGNRLPAEVIEPYAVERIVKLYEQQFIP